MAVAGTGGAADRAKPEWTPACATARFQATETGSGRARTFSLTMPGVSDAVALSLIAASQRGGGVWVRHAAPAVSWSRIAWLVT